MNNIPYTYLIGWKEHNIFYYGVRYSKYCSPSDLWKTYFTSSKHVRACVLKCGNPNIIQIRKTFCCVDDAINWEKTVLKRMRVLEDDRFLNKNVAGAIRPLCGADNPMYGRSRRGEKHKGGENISRALKKYFSSEESVEERLRRSKSISGTLNPMYGKTHTEEHKKYMSELYANGAAPFFGKRHTEETKRKMSERQRGRPAHNKGVPMKEEQKQKMRKPKTEEHKQNMRITYVVDGKVVLNAKEWCLQNGHNYNRFTQAAKYGLPYKGMHVQKQGDYSVMV